MILKIQHFNNIETLTMMSTHKPKRLINLFRHVRGFADFIRGTAYLTTLMQSDCEVCWSIDGPLREILEYPGEPFYGEPKFHFDDLVQQKSQEQRRGILLDQFENDTTLTVMCHLSEAVNGVFPEVAKNFFVLKEEYMRQFERFFQEMAAGEKYRVIHCRLGDAYMVSGESPTCYYQKYFDTVTKMLSEEKTILLTDDAKFKEFIVRDHSCLKTTTNSPIHTASGGEVSLLAATLFEMLLMTRASRVDCLTSLPWGRSGFSRVPAKVFQVPYTHTRIT